MRIHEKSKKKNNQVINFQIKIIIKYILIKFLFIYIDSLKIKIFE
jgi:hypothetical protein